MSLARLSQGRFGAASYFGGCAVSCDSALADNRYYMLIISYAIPQTARLRLRGYYLSYVVITLVFQLRTFDAAQTVYFTLYY